MSIVLLFFNYILFPTLNYSQQGAGDLHTSFLSCCGLFATTNCHKNPLQPSAWLHFFSFVKMMEFILKGRTCLRIASIPHQCSLLRVNPTCRPPILSDHFSKGRCTGADNYTRASRTSSRRTTTRLLGERREAAGDDAGGKPPPNSTFSDKRGHARSRRTVAAAVTLPKAFHPPTSSSSSSTSPPK